MPTLLIIDDDPTLASFVSAVGRETGWETTEVTTSRNFRVPGSDVDLIILDIVMPDLDGFEVLQKLAAVASNIPLALVSAHPAYLMPASRLGSSLGLTILDALDKPITRDRLLILLNGFTRRT